MDSKDISIVICTRNRPEMVRQCLQSILMSASLPGEVLIVDQSTDDFTLRIVSDISKASNQLHLRYLKMDTAGLTSARNQGMKSSRGKVVAFTDDDCIISPYWIVAIAREFEDEMTSCVCGSTLPANHLDRPKQAYISTLWIRKRASFQGKCNAIMVGRGNNMAFSRDILLKLGGFNERIGEGTRLYAGDDLDIFYRLLEAGGSIAHSPDAIVLHTQPDDWEAVFKKKRGYAISVAALLGCRLKQGDLYAGLLLAGRILYELGYLICVGMLRMNLRLACVGWHSLAGSISGLRQVMNQDLAREVRDLSVFAKGSFASGNGHSHATPDLVDSPVKER